MSTCLKFYLLQQHVCVLVEQLTRIDQVVNTHKLCIVSVFATKELVTNRFAINGVNIVTGCWHG